jgi:uncharacterized protein
VTKRKRPGKLVLALDEFQWMVATSPELPSVIQELWDRHWRRAGDIMLILCGSYLGFMEREVLGKKSPLFGRRTAQIQLRPFAHREAGAFHPGWSRADRATLYFICGGIPFYLRLFDPRRSVERNVEAVVLDELGPLFREPDFLLREELREVESYYAVLLAIAEGRATVRDIATRSMLPERSLPYYLQQLVELGYIARRYPLSEVRPAVRHVRFVLTDPLLRFWFRFVFPNLSFLQQMGPKVTWRDRIRPELPSYFGGCFERLCREALPQLYEREGVGASFEIGEYWSPEVQVDVVGLRQDNWIDLGECKWGTVASAPAVFSELEAKAQRFPNRRQATIGLRLFVKTKTKGQAAASSKAGRITRVHDLADLYE